MYNIPNSLNLPSSLSQHADKEYKSANRQEVKELAVWFSLDNLELNTLKTVEMIVDFRRNLNLIETLSAHYHCSLS